MQLHALHRRANLRAIRGFAGISLFGFNGLALAMIGSGLFATPFRPDFHPVARVLCPQSAPLPRTLIDAAACGDLFRLRMRIAEGADLAATDTRKPLQGRTALHHAVQRGDKDVVKALLAAGANPDAADAAGNSAMHLLAMRPRTESDAAIVDALIQAGADGRLRNAKGRTALTELLNFTTYSIDPVRIGVERIGGMFDEAEAKGPLKARSVQAMQVGEGQVSGADERQGDRPLAPASPQGAETSVREALEAWAGAWSARNIDAYLDHYASDFRPADGRPREQWRVLRRERIGGASSIEVKLTDVKILVDGSRAVAHFRQHYRSDALKSVDQKTVVLSKEAGDWRIVEEKAGK